MRKQPTEEQKQAAARKREAFTALAKQLADMTEAERIAIADRTGRVLTVEGRELSMVNTLLSAVQFPSVSMAGGFVQWIRAGRVVRKGAKGINIWVPIAGRKGAEQPEAATDGEPQKANGGRPRFIMGTVFDVSQTEAMPGRETDAPEDEAAAVLDVDAGAFALVS